MRCCRRSSPPAASTASVTCSAAVSGVQHVDVQGLPSLTWPKTISRAPGRPLPTTSGSASTSGGRARRGTDTSSLTGTPGGADRLVCAPPGSPTAGRSRRRRRPPWRPRRLRMEASASTSSSVGSLRPAHSSTRYALVLLAERGGQPAVPADQLQPGRVEDLCGAQVRQLGPGPPRAAPGRPRWTPGRPAPPRGPGPGRPGAAYPGDDSQRALRAGEQLGQVVPGVVLGQAGEAAHHRTVGEYRLHAGHLGPHAAVAQ